MQTSLPFIFSVVVPLYITTPSRIVYILVAVWRQTKAVKKILIKFEIE